MRGWRFKCPHGHTSVELVDGHFVCRACSRSAHYGRGTYDEVQDTKTGERVDREDVARLELDALEATGD